MGKKFEIVGDDISDGYHTFTELYEHRCTIFVALCNENPLKACLKRDPETPGWVILYYQSFGGQVSYHIPERMVAYLSPVIRERDEKWDGHTSKDVLERLRVHS